MRPLIWDAPSLSVVGMIKGRKWARTCPEGSEGLHSVDPPTGVPGLALFSFPNGRLPRRQAAARGARLLRAPKCFGFQENCFRSMSRFTVHQAAGKRWGAGGASALTRASPPTVGREDRTGLRRPEV